MKYKVDDNGIARGLVENFKREATSASRSIPFSGTGQKLISANTTIHFKWLPGSAACD